MIPTNNTSFFDKGLMEIYTVSFFGHRYIDNILKVEEQLEAIIRQLLSEHEYCDFLVGRDGEFDQCVSSTIIRVKKHYRDDNSCHILVLPYARHDYLDNQESFENYYDEIEIDGEAASAHFKAAFQKRNRSMVDRSDLVIFDVEHNSGGAYQTMQYAIKQNKNIINLAEMSD